MCSNQPKIKLFLSVYKVMDTKLDQLWNGDFSSTIIKNELKKTLKT